MSCSSDPPRRKLKGVRGAFEAHMQAFAAEELAGAIPVPTKGPEYGIVGIVERWAEGADFDRLVGHTSLAPGDLVRLLRMTNQLLRQTAHALPAGDPVIGVLLEARRRIDRDVVDARRQLELG